jgi:Cu2+-exporting ATPase
MPLSTTLIHTPPPNPSPELERACAHCGLPAQAPRDPSTPSAPAFCCHGCEAVYTLMQEERLGDFYTLRDRSGEVNATPRADASRLALADAAYAHLDAALDPQAEGPQEVTLYMNGVHCAACAWVLERAPARLEGVLEAQARYAERTLTLTLDPRRARLSAVAAHLHRLGYEAYLVSEEAVFKARSLRRRDLLRLGVTFAIMGNVMLMAIAEYVGGVEPELNELFRWLSLLLATPQVTYGAWPFWVGALRGVRARSPHMDMPVVAGLSVAYLASAYATLSGGGHVYFDSLCALVFLLLLGRYAQTRGHDWASEAADVWRAYTPQVAWRAGEPGAWRPTPLDEILPGDLLRVRVGEVCPVDGLLRQPEAHFDEATLTGESRPARRGEGEWVYQGSICVGGGAGVEGAGGAGGVEGAGGVALVEARVVGRGTRLGALIEQISRARSNPARSEVRADRVAAALVVSVIALAAAAALYWGVWREQWSVAFDVVVSLCVITCPCALGLATPLALAVSRARATRAGLLIRDASALERAAQLSALALDKTGTLTEGRLSVTSAEWLTPSSPALYALVAALEEGAQHPAAPALRAWALRALSASSPDALSPDRPLTPTVREWAERPGVGVEAVVEPALKGGAVDGAPCRVRLGRPPSDLGHTRTPAAARAIEGVAARGETPVCLSFDGEPALIIGLSDPLRAESREVIAALRSLGLRLSLLSGDHPAVVARVAERVGLDEARGAQSPEQKAEVVEALRAGGERVGVVGDGVNDALAFARADLGVAVQGGAAVVIEVAGAYLRRGVRDLPLLIQGARSAARLARFNLAFALVYNVVFATLALMGHINPLAAAVLMPLSSLSVTLVAGLWRSFPDPKSVA